MNGGRSMAGPLEGLRVLDLTRILSGPFTTMMFSDLGAEVIKIERPEGGDLSRGTAPFIENESYYFISVNRGKKSATLDLSKPEGAKVIKDLILECDVIIENFIPGTMEKFGLDYQILSKLNPRLIYCAISGFGQTGPYAAKPALDIIVQAMGGMMSITGELGGGPVRPGSSLGDIIAGLFSASGVLSALYEREISGEGQMIDVSMLDCQVATLEAAVGRYFSTGEIPKPIGTRHPSFTPFQAFETSDAWIVVAIVGGVNDQWPLFCSAIEQIDLIDDPRYVDGYNRTLNYDSLIPMVQDIIKQKDESYWLDKFSGLGIACGPVNTIDKVVKDPQIISRGTIVKIPHKRIDPVPVVNTPLKFSRTTSTDLKPAPDLGEHNDYVLREIVGYSEEAIQILKNKGVFG
jgi:CoA:oxalate CoA-transferase